MRRFTGHNSYLYILGIFLQCIAGGKAKVLVYTDLSITVGSFGYQIIQKKYFNDLIIQPNTKVRGFCLLLSCIEGPWFGSMFWVW